MPTTVKIELNSVEEILKARNLQAGGQAQRFLTNEVWRLSDPYIPFDTGMLKSNVSMPLSGDCIVYNSPYAKYLWYGKVTAGNPRQATGKNINYEGAQKRGKEWTKRMWADRSKEIVSSVAKFVGGRAE